MKKTFKTLLLLSISALGVRAQTTYTGPTTQPFGKVDIADLQMTSCDFEKDANAEVLFDKGTVYFDDRFNMIFERHTRIKILNDKGLGEANIKIRYYGGDRSEYIEGVQAETINLVNGAPKITKVDRKQVYSKAIDKVRTELTFAFPDAKAGSIIEYKYTLTSEYLDLFPDWFFQHHIPVRYSEFESSVPTELYYKKLVMTNLPFVKSTDNIKAMANIPSLHDEPYMSSWRDNAQRMYSQLLSVRIPGYIRSFSDSWNKVGEDEAGFDDFGGQLHRKLSGEDEIINKAKSLNTQAEKIAYVFDQVKNKMKWNEVDVRYADDGTSEAWNKKTGNSTEINLIVCHLLQKAGVKAVPMLVSTRENGKVNPAFSSRYQFDKTVAYIPVDSANYYLLDATSKYNVFNQPPQDLLNSYGLYVDGPEKKYELVFLKNEAPVREIVLLNAEVKPDGKVLGNVQINSFGYNRIDAIESYKKDGEDKYIKDLQGGNNDLKISNLKLQNMEVDTLPLSQSMDFSLASTGSDDNYIYVKPALIGGFSSNPFLNENRYTDIDFKYKDNFNISVIFKIPAGYKVDALPKSASMAMSDKSLFFKRLAAQQDDQVVVRYTIDYRKSIFFKEDYTELHEFFKKMTEMLNEQIVLKKG